MRYRRSILRTSIVGEVIYGSSCHRSKLLCRVDVELSCLSRLYGHLLTASMSFGVRSNRSCARNLSMTQRSQSKIKIPKRTMSNETRTTLELKGSGKQGQKDAFIFSRKRSRQRMREIILRISIARNNSNRIALLAC